MGAVLDRLFASLCFARSKPSPGFCGGVPMNLVQGRFVMVRRPTDGCCGRPTALRGPGCVQGDLIYAVSFKLVQRLDCPCCQSPLTPTKTLWQLAHVAIACTVPPLPSRTPPALRRHQQWLHTDPAEQGWYSSALTTHFTCCSVVFNKPAAHGSAAKIFGRQCAKSKQTPHAHSFIVPTVKHTRTPPTSTHQRSTTCVGCKPLPPTPTPAVGLHCQHATTMFVNMWSPAAINRSV
jgi:hypothetical protein